MILDLFRTLTGIESEWLDLLVTSDALIIHRRVWDEIIFRLMLIQFEPTHHPKIEPFHFLLAMGSVRQQMSSKRSAYRTVSLPPNRVKDSVSVVKACRGSLHSPACRLMLMRTEPLLSIPQAAKILGLTVPTVTQALGNLQQLGNVWETTERKRGRLVAYSDYLRILNQGQSRFRGWGGTEVQHCIGRIAFYPRLGFSRNNPGRLFGGS